MAAGATRSQTHASDAEQLRETRDLLEQERRRYAELFDLAPVGYLLTDLDGVVLEANRAARELLARDVDDLIGTPLVDLIADDRREDFAELVRELARGARWQDELPFRSGAGGSTLLLVYAAAPEPGRSDPVRWALADAPAMAPSRDRSDLSGVRLDRLSHVLDRLHYCVLTLDRRLRVSYANSAAEALLGDGRSLAGTALPDPWPELSLRALAAKAFEPEAETSEEQAVFGDRAYEVLALPPDRTGHALLVIADMSAAKRRERAERAFIANAAHQLRTPVSAIAGAIEVLQGGAKEIPETRDRFLSHLDNQCDRLVRLTRALLVLARAEALAEAPELELVPVRPLLESIVRRLHPATGVEMQVQCPPDLAALTNPDLLAEAVGNLAENAAKFTRAGEIVLCAESAENNEVRIVVSDTGPGMELPEDGSFRRFYHPSDSESDGFGLGLAIAAEAARVLGGQLRVESSSRGTRATTTLPAARLRTS